MAKSGCGLRCQNNLTHGYEFCSAASMQDADAIQQMKLKFQWQATLLDDGWQGDSGRRRKRQHMVGAASERYRERRSLLAQPDPQRTTGTGGASNLSTALPSGCVERRVGENERRFPIPNYPAAH